MSRDDSRNPPDLSVGRFNGLRKIMLRLEDMPDSPEVAELHSLATDSMYSLCGAGGDY